MPNSPARALGIGLLAAIGAFGHLVYPLWLALRTRRAPEAEPPEPEDWPGVTVVVPAYRERNVIAAKIDDLSRNGYPGPLQILVVADDADTATAARATAAEVLDQSERVGKAEALNRGVEAAGHELVVLTDANARLEPGSLALLVRWFEDPSVGAVAGEKRVLEAGEALYWLFESWLKRREFRTGTTIGLVGELAAVRASAYRPLPPDLLVDDLWLALDVIEDGLRIAYEPGAVAVEEGCVSWREEWERRTRRVAGALDVLWRRRELLVPGRSSVAAQLWGHKLVRSSLGPLAHAALLALALRSLDRSRLARVSVLAHVAGAAAVARRLRGASLTRAEQLAAQVLFLQAVGLGGTRRWLRGERTGVWPKGERRLLPGSSDTTRREGAR